MRKFFLWIFIATFLGIFMLDPHTAAAAEIINSGSCGGSLTWVLTDDGVLTISGTGKMTDFNLNYTDTRPPWWDEMSTITSIVIEDGVEGIGNNAFITCSNVTSVSLPDSVTTIGAQAFRACRGLTTITLPKDLATVPTYGFYGCNKLTEVILPENLVTIGTYAFSGCSNLSQITIPYSTKNIYTGAFDSCTKLKTVYRYASSTWEYSFSSSPTIKTMYLITYILNGEVHSTESVVSGGNAVLLQEPADYFYEYYVDGTAWTAKKITQDCTVTVTPVPAYTVTYTGAYSGTDRVKEGTNATLPTPPAYYEYSFTVNGNVWTGENITGNVTVTVTQKATCGENLTWSINQNTGALVISGSGPMYNFTSSSPAPWYSNRASIRSLSLPQGLTTIGDRAFANCSELTGISLSSSITSIGSYAFSGCTKLSSVTLPSTLSALSSGIFENCSALQSITLPDTTTSIGSCAFSGCTKLSSVNLPSALSAIPYATFENCSALKSVTLPDTIASIGSYAFYNSGIESIVIPANVERIEEYTFAGCYSLTSLTLPDNLKYIGSNAFSSNNVITSVNISSLTSWLNIQFLGNFSTSNPLANGASLVVNGTLLTHLEIPSTVSTVNTGAFYGYQKLTSVVVPSHVTSVGKDAFHGCTNLTYADISSTSIGIQSFYGCSRLSTVILNGSLKTIPENVFSECTSLTSIDIPDTVTTIGASAFYNCSALERIKMPSQIMSIANVALYNCTSLRRVYLTDLSSWMNASLSNYSDPFAWGAQLYLNGELVTDLVIPDDITYVQNLYNCNIRSIYLHRNVRYVYGMSYNEYITTVYAPISFALDASYCFSDSTEIIPYCTVDYVKDNEVICSHAVYVGENSTLPQPSAGEYYCFEVNGTEWDGKNVTADTTVSVYPGVLVTYTGDYSGTDVVKSGGSVSLPTEGQGLYLFEVDGNAWTGTNITENITVDVIALTPFDRNPNAGWNYKDNVLRIGGTGTMPEDTSYPWDSITLQIVEVKIGDGITNIGGYAFDGCWNLESVAIGSSVVSIGTEAFDDSPKLKSIIIPDSVTSIGAYAFEDCYALASVTIGSGLETIGKRAFRYNEVAEYVIHEDNPYFKTVDGNIFSKDGTVLVRYAIAKKDSSYVIPEGVTTVGFAAFESAAALKRVTIPTSVTTIEDSAFWLVDSSLNQHRLTTVYYEGSVSQWYKVSIKSYNDALFEAEIQFARLELVLSAVYSQTSAEYIFDIALDEATIAHLETATLILALYDSDNRLIALSVIPVSPDETTFSITVEKTETASNAKILSLISAEIPTPLCKAKIITIE